MQRLSPTKDDIIRMVSNAPPYYVPYKTYACHDGYIGVTGYLVFPDPGTAMYILYTLSADRGIARYIEACSPTKTCIERMLESARVYAVVDGERIEARFENDTYYGNVEKIIVEPQSRACVELPSYNCCYHIPIVVVPGGCVGRNRRRCRRVR